MSVLEDLEPDVVTVLSVHDETSRLKKPNILQNQGLVMFEPVHSVKVVDLA